MKALLLVLFFGAAGCFLWFSLLCLRMIEYDEGECKRGNAADDDECILSVIATNRTISLGRKGLGA